MDGVEYIGTGRWATPISGVVVIVISSLAPMGSSCMGPPACWVPDRTQYRQTGARRASVHSCRSASAAAWRCGGSGGTLLPAMRTALVSLVSVALGALAAVGVTAWEPWDGNGENADDAGEAEELSLTLDAEDAASFAAAADRLETLLPDFDCSGGWDDRERPLGSGALEF